MNVLEKEAFTLDVKGNYTGPRGEQVVRGSDGNDYKTFICHGCQSCYRMTPDGEDVIDTGPHCLSPLTLVKDI